MLICELTPLRFRGYKMKIVSWLQEVKPYSSSVSEQLSSTAVLPPAQQKVVESTESEIIATTKVESTEKPEKKKKGIFGLFKRKGSKGEVVLEESSVSTQLISTDRRESTSSVNMSESTVRELPESTEILVARQRPSTVHETLKDTEFEAEMLRSSPAEKLVETVTSAVPIQKSVSFDESATSHRRDEEHFDEIFISPPSLEAEEEV